MSLAQPPEAFTQPRGQVFRFALRGASVPPSSATLVAEAFRAAVLSSLHAITGGRDSFLLSGHDARGVPDNVHRHAYYLPTFDRDDGLEGILVLSPKDRFSLEEADALKAVKAIRWAGPSTRTSVEMLDSDDTSCFQVASNWISATPFAPCRRFWGTSGKHHLTPERQLASELNKLVPGLQVAAEIESEILVRLRLAEKSRLSRPQWQRAFQIRCRTSVPICGPIVLGHSCHFGLGLFVPFISE
jgi:CRISPR-associated protein Csb2